MKKAILETLHEMSFKNEKLTEIINFGLNIHVKKDVIFEKSLKLYCQMIIL